MICKKCQKELTGEGIFCPYCGEKLEQEPAEAVLESQDAEVLEPVEEICEEVTAEEAAEEASEEAAVEAAEDAAAEEQPEVPAKKKLKTWQLVLAIVGGVVLLGVLVCAVLHGLGVNLMPRENNVLYKDSYTVSDEKALAAADQVVATMGDKTLTNAEMQLHYWSGAYEFINNYYYYLSMMGMDLTQPLDEQMYLDDESMTWQHYFVDYALDSWQYYTTLALLAEDAGFALSEETQQYLDELPTYAEEMATAYGYESILAWLQEDAGPGVTMEGYTTYISNYYLGAEYLASCYETLAPTAEEADAYYTENQAALEEEGITKDMGLNASVRHILIAPATSGTDEEGNAISTEEDWAAAYAEAEQILNEWKSGAATEDSFAELVATYTDDSGSATTGGLYEDVNIDASYVTNFKTWASDAARVTGDTDIVETEYGYHIMYFVSGEEYWLIVTQEQLLSERIESMLAAGTEKYPMEVNYKKIVLGEMSFA